MNIDIKVRHHGKTIFKRTHLPLNDGIESLSALAQKYGFQQNINELQSISNTTQKKLRQIRKIMIVSKT